MMGNPISRTMAQLAEDARLLELQSLRLLGAARNFLAVLETIEKYERVKRLERKPQMERAA